VSPVKYELGFYIPKDAILHIDRRENLKSDNETDHSVSDPCVTATRKCLLLRQWGSPLRRINSTDKSV
jgi:hypothetical protein